MIISVSNVVRGVPKRQKPFVIPAWMPGAKLVRLNFKSGEWAIAIVRQGNTWTEFYVADEGLYYTTLNANRRASLT